MNEESKNFLQKRVKKVFYELGRWSIDISKLAFASLVLGAVLRWDISNTSALFIGLAITGIGALVGFMLVTAFMED